MTTRKSATTTPAPATTTPAPATRKRVPVAPTLNPPATDERARYFVHIMLKSDVPTVADMRTSYAYTVAADNKTDAVLFARALVRQSTLWACGEIDPNSAYRFHDEDWRVVQVSKQVYRKSAPAMSKNARKRAARATSTTTTTPAPAPVRTNKGTGRKNK